jgi:putative hydrolase
MPDLRQFVDRFREGGLAALVQTREQRDLMDDVQATMALIEGHAEHVMDALAPELLADHEDLRAALQRRRASRSAPERILQRLLGLNMKMRQYELGKSFCDAVVAEGGVEALSSAWESPDSAPTLAELERPSAWLARTPAAA